MTTLSPPPVREKLAGRPSCVGGEAHTRSRRGKTPSPADWPCTRPGGLTATYETSPGGALWGAEKAVFPGHHKTLP